MPEYILRFTREELKILNDALVERPYKEAAPLIAHINSQIKVAFDAQANGQTGGRIDPPADNRGD